MGPPGLPGASGGGSGSGGADFTGAGNPQGVQTAVGGQTYRDTTNGILYIHLPSGSTNTGWYRIINDMSAVANAPARFALETVDNSGSLTQVSLFGATGGLSSATVAFAGSAFTDGPALDMTTTSTSIGGIFASNDTTASGQILWSRDFDISFKVRTDDSSLTDVEMWVGFETTNPSGGNIAGRAVAFRYINGTDTGWVGYTNDNGVTGPHTTAALNTMATATTYLLRMRLVRSTNTVYFSVNDGAETSTTTGVPGSADTNRAFMVLYIFLTTGSASHNMYFYRAGGWMGTS